MPEIRQDSIVVQLADGTRLVQVGWWCDDCIAAHPKRLNGTTHGERKDSPVRCGHDYGDSGILSHLNVVPLYAALGEEGPVNTSDV